MVSFLKGIKWLLLLQALICLVKSDESIPFQGRFDRAQKYTFTLSNSNTQFIKVEVQGDSQSINYVISAYQYDSRDKRIQLAQSFSGVSKLYLSPKQVRNGKIYIDVECSDPSTCSGLIDVALFGKIVLTEGEPINYYATEKDDNIVFTMDLNTNSDIYSVCARGPLIESNLEVGNRQVESLKYPNCYLVRNDRGENSFTVTARKPGVIINIGYVGYTKESFPNNGDSYYKPSKAMIVDDATMTGVLVKGTIDMICYTVDIKPDEAEDKTSVFGTGVILTRIASAFAMFNNGTKVPGDPKDEIFNAGYLTMLLTSEDLKDQKVCITFPDIKYEQYSSTTEIVYYHQFTSGNTNENKLNIFEPQITGKFYPKIANQNSKIAFIGNTYDSNKVNFNIMTTLGYPSLTVVECTNYPFCSLDDETLKRGVTPRNVNRFSSYVYEGQSNRDYSPVSKTQPLAVVKCVDIEGIEDFDWVCGFGAIISGENDEIDLIEDIYFNQFALENKENYYYVQLSEETHVHKIFIDILTFVGDVEVIPLFQNVDYSQYRAANKIYISVKINKPQSTPVVSFGIKALSNAYYTILVNYGRDENVEEDSLIKNELQTGIPYLITIDPTKMDSFGVANKVVTFHNEMYIDYTPVVVNFYSLNCKVDVGIVYEDEESNLILEEIDRFEHFSHVYLASSEIKYYSEYFDFRINVTEYEPSQYRGKLCKILASGVEVTKEHKQQITRDIIVPDNILQSVRFGGEFKHISYGYVLVDFKRDLLISFNLKHQAEYKVRLYYENKKREKDEVIVADDVLYLNQTEWQDRCRDPTRICYIQLDITLENTKEEERPVLEVLMKSVDKERKTVSYLSKAQLKLDNLQNSLSQYYYTEIGQDDRGYINVNFFRGSGQIYARIVEANAKKEEGADWRQQFVLPSDDRDLVIDPYLRKLVFDTEDYNCENGCFLLINVFSDAKSGSVDMTRNYPFSIYVQSYPKFINYRDIPVITASIDEFIIGNIDFATQGDNNIYEYFQVSLTSDGSDVVIDFQSISGNLFVNVGDQRPTIKKADFSLLQVERDTLHILTKKEILDIYKQKVPEAKDSLNGLSLTIGIFANGTDSLYASPYALVVRVVNGNENDIYRVNSDQKALCRTKKISGIAEEKYRCVYAIEYDFLSEFNYLFVYPSVQEKSAFFRIYASYINQSDYEMGNEDFFKLMIPNENNCDYSSKNTKSDFLYIDYGLVKDYYVLVSVETDKETVVELMSSLYVFNNDVTANPSTSQLFMAPSENKFTLSFPTNNMVMANIRGIGGEAELYWESNPDNKYYLKGRDDRISITSDKSYKDHKLIINSNGKINDLVGFIFYVNYDIRNDAFNFDKLIFDKSVRYIYTDNDLPLYYYGKLSHNFEENDYYDIFFQFDILENYYEKELTFYNDIPYSINAYIVKEQTVFDLKKNPQLTIQNQQAISGIYDYSLRTGLIRVTQKEIKNRGISEYEKPYLFLKIEKRGFIIIDRFYKRIALEMTAVRSQPIVPLSELSYQYGSLQSGEKERKYRLRTDNSFKQMNLQFSSLEEALTIEIEGIDKKKKDLQLVEKKYGKYIYTLKTEQIDPSQRYVFLIVKRAKQDNNNLENFMFQYTFSNVTENTYSISSPKIKVEVKEGTVNTTSAGSQTRANYTIKVPPVEGIKDSDINYIVKVTGLGRMRNNKAPTKPFISPLNETAFVKEFYNPKVVNNQIDLSITNVRPVYGYAQVIAQIKNKERVDYLSYDIFDLSVFNKNKGGQSNTTGTGTNKTFVAVAIVVGVLLVLIVIALVVVVLVYQKKNKDLLIKVQTVSFQQERIVQDDDNLLIS